MYCGSVGSSAEERLAAVAAEARACIVCAPHLPLGPRPVFQASATARLLIVGQAPGTRVHESGVPWSDRSGDRLRLWTGLDSATFYNAAKVALLPMGLCYPGRLRGGGDAPPRPECAPLWHERLSHAMPAVRLTLLVGFYAQTYASGRGSLTTRVRDFGRYLPAQFPLPHPSWRVAGWEKRNPWFADEVLPALRQAIEAAVNGG